MQNTVQDLQEKAIASKMQYVLILALIAASIFGALRAVDVRVATTLNAVSAQIAGAGASAS